MLVRVAAALFGSEVAANSEDERVAANASVVYAGVSFLAATSGRDTKNKNPAPRA